MFHITSAPRNDSYKGDAQFRPTLGSRQTSTFSTASSEQSPERNALTATAIRIRKYGLGKSAKRFNTSPVRSSTPSPLVELNATSYFATPPLESIAHESTEDLTALPQPRSTTPMSFGRPFFKRAESSDSTIRSWRRNNDTANSSKRLTLGHGSRLLSDDSMKSQSNTKTSPSDSFTALPPTISRAAAKRLGVEGGANAVLERTVSHDYYSVSSLSDSYEGSLNAPSISAISEETVQDSRQQLGQQSVSNRDSWPLRSHTPQTPPVADVPDSFYASSSEDDGQDWNGSVASAKSSKTSYDTTMSKENIQALVTETTLNSTASATCTPSAASGKSIYQETASVPQGLAHLNLPRVASNPINDGSNHNIKIDGFKTAMHLHRPKSLHGEVHPAFRNVQQESRPKSAKKYDFEAHMENSISPDAAEKVIYHIFKRMDNFENLFNAARTNRGFYSVFKRHELELIKNALHNFSPAAWEHRESSPKEIIPGLGNAAADYTPTTYVQFHKRDSFVMRSLKSLFFTRCQHLLRQETINALHNKTSPDAKRVDDAIWRVWTFCNIFGSGKGTENDFVAQRAWLSGGVSFSTTSFTKSRNSGRSSHSTIRKASSDFGHGNPGGLGIAELHDLLEVWECSRFLLQGIMGPGRVLQARRYGVFNGMNINFTDPRAEEAVLEEWVHYLLTLGPSTVVDLAASATSRTANVFRTAADMGWSSWQPCPKNGCRGSFLRDIVASTLQEKLDTGLRHVSSLPTPHIQAPRESTPQMPSNQSWQQPDTTKKPNTANVAIPESDNTIGLWMQWANRHDEIASSSQERRRTTKSSPPMLAKQHQRYIPVLPQSPSDEGQRSQLRSSTSLSLFPPQYTRPTSPNPLNRTPSNTPSSLSRSGSIRSSGSAGRSSGEKQDSPLLTTPMNGRLSTCSEVST